METRKPLKKAFAMAILVFQSLEIHNLHRMGSRVEIGVADIAAPGVVPHHV
jgi:hypothetical protein